MEQASFRTSGAVFSDDRRYRYALWRFWGACGPDECQGDNGCFAAFIGLNPSTATETEDDPTVRRCIGFAKSWGYAGLFMLNLFALRATDPKVMLAHPDPIGEENDRCIREYHEIAGLTVAAWGVHGTHMDRGLCVARLERVGPHAKTRYVGDDLWCLGVTKDGHPKHPLYLAAATKRRRFVIKGGL